MHSNVPNAPEHVGEHTSSPRSNNYYAYHDADDSAKLSTIVVHALADVMGVDVTDVGFSLSDTIDPESLDRLFSSEDDAAVPGHVAFTVDGYRVTVYGDGEIVITPPADPNR